MTVRRTLDLPCDPVALWRLLRDPARRPEWQSTLRRVDDVRGSGEVGSTWTDVTWPGLRPRMRTTRDAASGSGARWAEHGRWRGWRAELSLDLRAGGDGTLLEVVVDIEPPGPLARLRPLVETAAERGIVADLRRAGLIARASG